MDLEKGVIEVNVEEIIPNRFQPRLNFDEKALNELAESIKQHGIIQPLVLRKLGDKYEIIAGERRYKAAQIAGLLKVPAIVANIDDNASAEVALVENVQRKNLTAIEEAKSYKNLLDRGYLTQEDLAKRMGVSQSAISNKLRLLNLAEEVQNALLGERISERHARSLLQIEDQEEQKRWLDRIINERMTVRQLDVELRKTRQSAAEDNNDVPLVNLTPDINQIKENAMDINPEPEPKFVEEFFPEESQEEIQAEQTPAEVTEEASPKKFFNFLEDEAANLSTEENAPTGFEMPAPIEEISPAENPIEQAEPILEPVENNYEEEILEMPSPGMAIRMPQMEENQSNIMPETNFIEQQPPVSEPVEEVSEEIPSSDPIAQEEIPVEQFQPQMPEIAVEPPQVNNELNNRIVYEEVKREETQITDPVSMIERLDPEFEKRQIEAAGMDLKTAISIVRDNVKELQNRGFEIETEEIDLPDKYHIVIEIKKNDE